MGRAVDSVMGAGRVELSSVRIVVLGVVFIVPFGCSVITVVEGSLAESVFIVVELLLCFMILKFSSFCVNFPPRNSLVTATIL